MTTTELFLAELRKHDIKLWAESGTLNIDAPAGTLKPSYIEEIRLRKTDLLRLVGETGSALDQTKPMRSTCNIPLPLSFAQKRLWFIEKLGEGGGSYHISLAVRLTGKLNHTALRAALNALIARHEVLRTRFAEFSGEPCQIVCAAIPMALAEFDLENHSAAERDLRLLRHVSEECRTPFDLATGQLIRGRLIRLAEDVHALLITMHHIVADGWSTTILVRDVATLYLACEKGTASQLEPLELQYADYAAGQAQDTTIASSEHHNRYWQEELRHVPVLLNLPTDHPRPARRSFRGASVPFSLGTSLTASLKALAQSCNTTLFVALQTALTVLMARLSGEADLVIGTAVANRHRLEFEALIGLFVNMLPLRMSLRDDPSLAELLRRAREVTLGALTHQEVPFEHIVEMARVPRSLSHSPLFQVVLTLHNTPDNQFRLPDLVIAPMHIPQTAAQWDLSLSVQEAANELTGTFSYAVDLFDEETIKRWARHLQCVLQAMVQDVRQRVSEVSLLSADVRERCLQDIGLDCHISAAEFTLHEMFERQAEKTPNATAVVFEGARLTYKQLNERANRIANYLHSRGVRANQVVAICAEQSIERVAAIIGICKVGAAYLPVDPRYVTQQVARILCEGSPQCILTTDHLAPLFSVYDAVPIESLDVEADVISKQSAANRRDPAVTKRSVAYVIFTSGSTGYPKGVIVEHSNVINLFAAAQDLFHFNEQDVWTQFHSISFDFAVWEMWGALLHGGKLVLVSDATARSPSGFYSLLREERVTVLSQTPTAFAQLCAIATSVPASDDVNSLRWVIFGGESLDIESLAPWIARYGADRPQLVNMFGITETTVHATFHRVLQRDIGRPQRSLIGKSLPGWHVLILDGRSQPVPIGVVGEIYIGGAGVARGYLNRADLTAERFIADPFGASGGRLYKSGDLGRYRADGNIEYVGRNDFQVKIRGYRIELGEIESKLSSCEGVREAVVLAREDIPGEKRLVAYVTAQTGEPLVVSALRERLSAELPEYLVPAAYVQLSSLPLTLNGKLDRKALPAPDEEAYSHRRYEAPQGEIEELLAGIWQELLGVERVGRNDNFFELGGHSLMIMHLLERLRRAGISLPVHSVFLTPTLRELSKSATIEELDKTVVPPNRIPAGCESIIPAMLTLIDLSQDEIDTIANRVPGGGKNIQDIYPLAPLQEGIFFHHLYSESSDPYITSMLLATESGIVLDAFLKAVQATIDRHDILRSAVLWKGLRRPLQVVYRQAAVSIANIELDRTQDPVMQLKTLMSSEPRKMDIQAAPLIRLYLARLPDVPKCYILVDVHHIIDDATSLRQVIAELLDHLLKGSFPTRTPVAYREYVSQALAKAAKDDADAYFLQILGDVREPTIPFGLANARGDGSNLMECSDLLQGATAERIRLSASRLRMSVATLFHLAWGLVVARTSGRNDVVFGSVLLGRLQGNKDVDRAVGLFINTLPLRLRLRGRSAIQAVEDSQHAIVSLLAHEQTPLVRAQRHSGIGDSESLFSSIINFRHHARHPKGSANQIASGLEVIASQERSSYPLALSVDDSEDGFRLTVQVDRSVDPDRVIAYVHTAVVGLVDALEKRPNYPVLDIAIMPALERERVLQGFNATHVEYPEGELVHELFEAQVERTPDAVAVVFEGEQLSYAQLNARANQLARYLVCAGVQPDDRVAICVERGFEMIVGLLGILKAGGAYVPLDPQYPAERLAYMLQDSAPVVLLTRESMRETFNAYSTVLVSLDKQWSEIAKLDQSNIAAAELGLNSKHLAYVIYTSGSTGLPKGVMNQHRGLINRLKWMQDEYQLDSCDRVLQKTPFGFDVSAWEFFWTLLNGARLVLARPQGHKDVDYLKWIIQEEGITTLHFVPSMLRSFLVLGADKNDLESLRYVICSGEELTMALQTRCLHFLPQVRLLNLYGPTEAAIDVTYWECQSDDVSPCVPIGRPIWNTQIYILDGYLQPVPIGVVGEIYIGGAGVARGYLNRADLTAERFIADPFGASGGRLYKSGDLGRYRADGNIEYVGRNDFQVKIRGYRIELGEIESKLSSCEGVREAVVLAREDIPGEKRLVAYVVADGDQPNRDLYRLPNGFLLAHINAHETERLYEEIFTQKTYIRNGIALEDGCCVFDIGANIGMFTLFICNRYANARVYSFEPVPPVFDCLSRNISLYNLKATPEACGIADAERTETVHYFPNMSVNSGFYADVDTEREVTKQFLRNKTGDESAIDAILQGKFDSATYECSLRTISQVIRQYAINRVDLLKIDVEKSELDVLLGIESQDWPKIQQIVVEVHDEAGRVQRIADMLKQHLFECEVVEEKDLKGTGLYLIYAIKTGLRTSILGKDAVGSNDAILLTKLFDKETRLAEWRACLQATMPEFMVPAAFVLLERLPLTPNGKLDRKALPAPDGYAYSHQHYEAPQGEIEERLAGIWQELLGTERVGRNDSFFELGGHSLLAASATVRANSLGIPITTLMVFELKSIKAISERLDNTKSNRIAKDGYVRLGRHDADHTIFLIAPGTGGAESYYQLAEKLGSRVSIIVPENAEVQAGHPLPYNELVHRYAQIVQSIPNDMSLIGGWSRGAKVAVALAGYLESRGLSPRRLVLGDPDAHDYGQEIEDAVMRDPRVAGLDEFGRQIFDSAAYDYFSYRKSLLPVHARTTFFRSAYPTEWPVLGEIDDALLRMLMLANEIIGSHLPGNPKLQPARAGEIRVDLNGFDRILLNAEVVPIRAQHDRMLLGDALDVIAARIRLDLYA